MPTLKNVIENVSGSVGIGTTTPTQALELRKNVGSAIALLNYNNTVKFNINASSAGVGYVGMVTNHDLLFVTNDTEKARLNTNGNLGIGTSNPQFLLDIVSTVSTPKLRIGNAGSNNGAQLILAGSNTTKNWVIANQQNVNGALEFTQTSATGGSSVDTTPSMVINSSGNVGIGTTNLAGGAKLTLNGNFGFSGDFTKYIYMPDIFQGTGSIYMQAGFGSNLAGGAIRLYGHNATTYTGGDVEVGLSGKGNFLINSYIGGTRLVTVKVDGNVGIGTTSPAYKLDVSGTGRVGDVFLITTATTSDARLEIGSGRSGNGNSYLDLIGDATYTDYGLRLIRYDSGANSNSRLEHRGTGQLQLFTTDAAAVTISTNSTERLRILSGGSVGIGTSSPSAFFHVYGVGLFGNSAEYVALGSYLDTFTGRYSILTTNNHGDFTFGSNLVIDTNHQLKTVNTHPSMRGGAIVIGGNGYDLGEDTIAFFSQAAGSATANTIVSSSFARMVVRNTGNVGIGTTLPTQLLDVRGNIKLGGDNSGNYVYYVTDIERTIVRTTRSDVSQEGLLRSDGWGNFTFNKSIGLGYSLGSGPQTGNIYAAGSVGIGTSTTTSGLQIQTEGTNTTSGSFLFVRSTNASFGGGAIGVGYQYAAAVGNNFTPFRIRAGTTNAIFVVNSAGVVYAGDTTGAVIYGNHDPYYAFNQDTNTGMDWASSDTLTFKTGGTERVRIDNVGNVGIGTSNPAQKLHIVGNVYGTTYGQFGTAVASGTNASYAVFGSNSAVVGVKLVLDSDPSRNDLVVTTTSGNIGIGTNTAIAKLDVAGSTKFGSSTSNTHQFTGSVNFGGSTYNNSVAIDKFEYFSLQPYIEGGSFPSNVLSTNGGNVPTFTTMTGSVCPFGKVAYNVSYYEAIGDFIPVQAGETLYGEIWAYRSSGATGTAGVFYCGIARYDKNKNQIDSNLGLTYFLATAATVPANSTWTKYSNTTTLPLTHTPYGSSDGGPVRYVRPYIIVNYTSGTIPTYWGAWKIRKQQLTRDTGAITISGSIGIGTSSPAYKLDVVSGSMKLSSAAGAAELYFGTLDAANIYLKRDNNYDLSLVQNASSGNSLYLAGAGNVYLSIDSNNNETTSAFIVQNNAVKAGSELFRVMESGNVGIGSSSPSAKLDVVDAGNFFVTRDANGYARFTTTNGSAQLGLFRTGTSPGGFYIGGDASLFSVWDTSFTRLVNINTSGNLGIQVSSPLTKLDIGNTQASGITMRYDTNTNYQAWIRPYWNSSTDTRIDFAINRISGVTPDVIMSVGYGGNVGIGTTSPSALLNIVTVNGSILYDNSAAGGSKVRIGSTGVAGYITEETSGKKFYIGTLDTDIRLNTGNGVSAKEFVFSSSGSLGIGTLSALSTLHLNGAAPTILTLSSTSYPSAYLTTFGVDSGARAFLIFGNNGENQIRAGRTSTGGYLDFYTNNTVAQTTLASDGNFVMRLAASGNIGIGSTTAGDKLSVFNGNISLSDSYKLYNGSANDSVGLFFSAALQANISAYSGIIFRSSTTNVSSQTERMRITNDGNIGIGTSNPTALLHNYRATSTATPITYIQEAASSPSKTNVLLIERLNNLGAANISASSAGVRIRDHSSNYGLSVEDHSGNSYLAVRGGGNVGIGTAIPTSKLNAYGSGSNLSVFKAEGGNGTLFEVTDQLSGSLFSVNTIAGIPVLEVFSNNRLVAGQYGSNALVISGSKVGIGLSTPLSNKSLSISGDAQVLGSFTKASGTFLIDHPDPNKPGWKLQHSFVESPTVGDNIYRYIITIDNTLSGSIELPSYWKHLNENPQIWISPVKHFGVAYGELSEELSVMNVYANSAGKYNILLIGTRKDPTIKRLMPEFNVEFESQ